MNNRYLKFEIQKSFSKIQYYRMMLNQPIHPYYKHYYAQLIKEEEIRINYLRNKIRQNPHNSIQNPQPREFTMEELAQYDGSRGNPAYVAVNGIVYDVSLEATWGGGTHFGVYAGTDATNEFNGCHGRETILSQLPKIGKLIDS